MSMKYWSPLRPGSPLLRTFIIPGANRRITLRNGSAGFVLVHQALFFNDSIERLDLPGNDAVDEGGHNYRLLTGSTSAYSKHAYGLAEDLNWNRHPYNVKASKTFTAKQIKAIRNRLKWLNFLAGTEVIIWGGNWPSHPGSSAKPDAMHFEIADVPIARLERLAKILAKTPRGKRILAANPGLLAVIKS